MATEEEKKIARAYNIGQILSVYEPRLLEQIVKNNPQNEFVKTMAVAKNHHEMLANIPKKELSREYKNGYFNAQSLIEHDPALLDRLIASKDASKDFKNGLAAGKKEYQVRQSVERIKQERENLQQRKIDLDRGLEL